MGRKSRVAESQRRVVRFQIMLTKEEAQEIAKAAEAAETSVSSFIRKMVIAQTKTSHDPTI